MGARSGAGGFPRSAIAEPAVPTHLAPFLPSPSPAMPHHSTIGERWARRIDSGGTTLVVGRDAARSDMPYILYIGPALPEDVSDEALFGLSARPLMLATLDLNPPVALLPTALDAWTGMPFARLRSGATGEPLLPRATSDHTVAPRRSGGALLKTGIELSEGLSILATAEIAAGADSGIFTLSASLEHAGAEGGAAGPIQVERLSAPVLPIPRHLSEMIQLEGRWCGEFEGRRRVVPRHATVIENRRGRTSHDAPPFLIFCEPDTTESRGEAIGVHLAWSGDHFLRVERTRDGDIALFAGEPRETVSLEPGQSTATPHLIVAHSSQGLNGLSDRFHGQLRALPHLKRARPRPVTVNTWEAVYFDHDTERLNALIDAAAEIGAERFVLDDGWFGGAEKGRDDDTSSLGDWVVDPRKHPNGLEPLAERVRGRGMEFGLWFEPEMISPDSDLYRAHPDWVMGDPNILGRNQLLLDIARPDVSEHLFDLLDGYVTRLGLAYIKWDMNRDAVAHDGEGGNGDQVRALYALLERLRATHPELEIESCASGGARVDFGILRRTDRIWTSDSNDPVERMRIQMGASRFVPPELMGAHVGPAWCHTTGRGTPADFRALVASWCHFGIEADLTRADDDTRGVLREAVARYKRDRHIWRSGRLWRIETADPDLAIVMAATPDRASARAVVAQLDRPRSTLADPLRLFGLDAERTYRVTAPVVTEAARRANRDHSHPLLSDGLVAKGGLLGSLGFTLPVLTAVSGLALEIEAID